MNYYPELIAPAGDWACLTSAVKSGADSVYFGVKGLNMRARASNFDLMEMPKIMKFLHDNGKKGYLSLNVLIYDNEINKVKKILDKAKSTGVDAVILWDMAVLNLAKKMGLEIHLSTQASVSNFEAFSFYASLGVSKIVLARECSIKDIKNITLKIKEKNISCGIEVFIHGAMCVGISGRCFMSQYTFGKSANRGECLQPCRRLFTIVDAEKEVSFLAGKNFLMSPKDLCGIYFIDRLINLGVSAFKIEGRARSSDYVKIATSVYRRAIDLCLNGDYSDKEKILLEKKLKKVYNRGFSSGFYDGTPGGKEFSRELKNEYEKIYIGEVVKFYKKISVAEIILRAGNLNTGDEILISGKNTPAEFFKVSEIEKNHKKFSSAVKGEKIAVKISFLARPNDKVFLWRPVVVV
ncbi:collagenase [Candidatus Omnitrophus magneticus]|uniref:Collagenase n=1 Tax=Candidatus Omnitrophus magneticus TaxID=1609969 RepID=A0A0F0CIX3_9BACT|nr:collagenase [Candidatus Omnitrophus magneticus]